MMDQCKACSLEIDSKGTFSWEGKKYCRDCFEAKGEGKLSTKIRMEGEKEFTN